MGEELTKRCSFGMTVVKCNEVGHWELARDDCACAADDIWPQTELNTRVERDSRGKLRTRWMWQWIRASSVRHGRTVDGDL